MYAFNYFLALLVFPALVKVQALETPTPSNAAVASLGNCRESTTILITHTVTESQTAVTPPAQPHTVTVTVTQDRTPVHPIATVTVIKDTRAVVTSIARATLTVTKTVGTASSPIMNCYDHD